MIDYAKLASEIRELVPRNRPGDRALLASRESSIRYSAPEIAGLHVTELVDTIMSICGAGPEFEEEWQLSIFNTWNAAHDR